MSRRAAWRWAAALVLLLVAHALAKPAGARMEMLWVCHLGTLGVAVGLVTGWRRLVDAAGLLYVAVGLPSYAVEVLTHGTTPTSVALHVATPVAAWLCWRAWGPPGRIAVVGGLAIFVLGAGLARLFTDPGLNVNVAYHPYFESWASLPAVLLIALNAAEALLLLGLGQRAVGWALSRWPT